VLGQGARVLLATCLTTVLSSVGNAHAETVIARIPNQTPISAYGGSVAWSRYDAIAHVYRLAAYAHGRVADLPVAPRAEPFDVDLGPNARGRLTAVYSRCRAFAGIPTGNHGCDIYQYTFASGTEQKLTKLSRADASEVLPSIWGRRVAFARTYEHRRGRSRYIPTVVVGEIDTGRLTRLGGGPPGFASADSWGPGPTSIDMRGHRVAYDWQFEPTSCGGSDLQPGDAKASELFLDTIGGTHFSVEDRCSGNAFTPVALAPGRIEYLSHGTAEQPASGEPHFRRFTLSHGGAYLDIPAPSATLTVCTDASSIYILRGVGDAAEVVRIDPTHFAPSHRATDGKGT
jgi:hypothetical protein